MNGPRTAIVSFVVAIVCARTALADGAQEIYAKHASAVVTIRTYDECLFPTSQGSGIIIKTDKEKGSFVLTNYHVIFRAGLIVVNTKAGNKLPAWICYFDEASDTALLRIATQDCTVPAAAPSVNIGSPVFAIGTPKNLGWTISNGIVSSVRTNNGNDLVQFTAPISHGSSGGPLFDEKGGLIGITSFKIRDSENLNFAIRTTPQTIREWDKQCVIGFLPTSEIEEQGWCIGHFEENDDWRAHNDKAKSWEAHSTLITDLEKKLDSLVESMSDLDREAQTTDLFEAADSNRAARHPANVLQDKINQAYANRYRDFPEDWRGWDGAYATGISSPRASQQTLDELVLVAINKWPHRYEVFNDFWLQLPTRGPRKRTEMWLKFIEATAESLPSKDDIASLLPQKDSARLIQHQVRLKELLASIRSKLKPISAGEFGERATGISRKLTAKGW